MPRVLIHIGYHKTGTNWLQDILWKKPRTGYRWLGKNAVRDIVLTRPFEFQPDAIRTSIEPLMRAAEEKGLLPVASLERLSGHPFSGGFDSREIAERLKQVFPDERVLIVIREQRSMILSTYKQYVTAGGACRLHDFLTPPKTKALRVPWFDFGHFEYDRLIVHYQSLFGHENVLVLPFELFTRDGRQFVERLTEFAGRPLSTEVLEWLPYDKRLNTARSPLTIEAMRICNRVSPRTELNPAPVAQLSAAVRLMRWLEKNDALDRRGLRKPAQRLEMRLRAVIDETVGDRYEESNRRTAELIGYDLGSLGWSV